jgi:hypothetical protein
MLGYYSPLLLLQAVCLYHAYRNNVGQRWFWLILFLPGVGCCLYLYDTFYSRRNVHTLTQGVKQVINRNYRIEQLEREVRFSGNVASKTRLADAYTENGRYPEAISLYRECLQGFLAGDPDLRMKLLQVCFQQKEFNSVIDCGNELENGKEKNFASSEARIAYAWALHYCGNPGKAEEIFDNMNRRHTNYRHRLEYCRFLKETGNLEKLDVTLRELLEEFDYITGSERKLHRKLIAQAKELYRSQAVTANT